MDCPQGAFNGDARIDFLGVERCVRLCLRQAASRGHVEAVKMLLAANADINATGKEGDTPLALAQLNDQKAVMRVLFTHAETTGGTHTLSNPIQTPSNPIKPHPRLKRRLVSGWFVALDKSG
jgi:hypothetical protein